MSIVTKSQILDQLADTYKNFLRKDLELALNCVLDEIARALSKQQSVEIRGFGSFRCVKQKARIGRNPRTGERIKIESKNRVQWKMSKKLFKLLNNDSNKNE